MRKIGTVLTIAVVALTVVAPVGAQPTFEMTVIPPAQTDRGEMRWFLVSDFNDKGQASGRIFESGVPGVAAARYSPKRGLEDLDPNGEYRSEGVSINAKGEVLGFIFGGELIYEDAFLHSPRSGFDLLEKGKRDDLLDGFIPGFSGGGLLSKAGSFSGGDLGLGPGEPSLRPIVYTKRDGWVDATGLSPRFAEEPTFGAFVGEGGHQVFMLSGQNERRQELFVRLPGGELVELVSPGEPFMSASRPNKKGRMGGLWTAENGRSRAFVFTPATGLVDIHPEGFKASYVTATSTKGAVVGVASPSGGKFTEIFVHTDQTGLRIVASAADFEALAEGRKGSFGTSRPEAINKKGEIVGCVFMKGGPDFPFYYSERHGLIDLRGVVEELDPSVHTSGCDPMLNNKGQILLEVREGDRSTGAILKVAG